MLLGIDPIGDDLHKATINLYGTVSDVSYSVAVNGQPAIVTSNATWAATNVPVTSGSTARFIASASGPQPVNAALFVDKPHRLFVSAEFGRWRRHLHAFYPSTSTEWDAVYEYEQSWRNGEESSGRTTSVWQDNSSATQCVGVVTWPPCWWPSLASGTVVWSGSCGSGIDPWSPPGIETGHCDVFDRSMWHGLDGSSFLDEYRRTAQTVQQLDTGGKAIPGRKALFYVHGGPYEILDKRADTPWQSLPQEDVIVGALGHYNMYAALYKGLPEGETVDATLRVDGKERYVLGALLTTPMQSKHKLRIMLGAPGAWVDVTDTNTPVVVGQGIGLLCQFAPPGPPLTNCQWALPEYAVAGYVADVDHGVLNTNITLTNESASFYWVDGGPKQVQCSVTVAGEIYTAQTTFQVRRPNASMTVQVMGTVAADDNFQAARGTWLHFGGTGVPTNPIPGIKFRYSWAVDDPDGMLYYVQVGTSLVNILAGNGTNYSGSAVGVDNGNSRFNHVYPVSADFPGEYAACDSPALYLCNYYTNVTRQDSFTMYLMFDPDCSTGKIPVPLKKVDWSWSGSAVLTNADQNLWMLASGAPPSGPAAVDTIFHPTWTNKMDPQSWVPAPPPTH